MKVSYFSVLIFLLVSIIAEGQHRRAVNSNLVIDNSTWDISFGVGLAEPLNLVVEYGNTEGNSSINPFLQISYGYEELVREWFDGGGLWGSGIWGIPIKMNYLDLEIGTNFYFKEKSMKNNALFASLGLTYRYEKNENYFKTGMNTGVSYRKFINKRIYIVGALDLFSFYRYELELWPRYDVIKKELPGFELDAILRLGFQF